MNIKKNIPNTITLGNLLCGCLAIIQVFEGSLTWAAYFVGIALVLDFFDGFTARLLKVASPIGKDLDSLADMVTFGVVPGLVMFKLISYAVIVNNQVDLTAIDGPAAAGWTIYPPESETQQVPLISYVALIIPIFSCIRLAKFNNDTRQGDSFIGLPTPANAMVICSLPLIISFQPQGITSFVSPWLLCLVSCVLSLLLVAELPLFALKFKGFGWADNQNKLRFIFLGLALILLLSLQFMAIPLIILLYILLSIVNTVFFKSKSQHH